MYIPWDPPLVLHVVNLLAAGAQPVTSPHACAEVGLGSDLNGKTKRATIVPVTRLKYCETY